MGFCGWLNYVLTLSMSVSMICSLACFVVGLWIRFAPGSLFSSYVDLGEKGISMSKLTRGKDLLIPTSDDFSDIDFGVWPHTLGNMLILLGLFMALFSLFGIVASISRKTLFLAVLAFVIMLAIVAKFCFLIYVIDLTSSLHDTAQDESYNKLRNNYNLMEPGKYTKFFNSLMLQGECCGVFGPADFQGLGSQIHFKYQTAELETMTQKDAMVPPACCRNAAFKMGYDAVLSCVDNVKMHNISNRGCYLEIYKHVTNWYGDYISGLFSFMLLWEMLQVVMAISVIFRPKPSEKETLKAAMAATGLTKAELIRKLEMDEGSSLTGESAGQRGRGKAGKQAGKKGFVPYWKLSSRTHLDRQPSTQIW